MDKQREKIDRLAEIKLEMEALKLESERIQGEFLKESEVLLVDTKRKSIAFSGSDGNRVTATMADSVKVLYPTYLERIFGEALPDMVKIEPSYKLTAPAARMLAGIHKGAYLKSTIFDVVRDLGLPENTGKALLKKVKGINYDKDVQFLETIGGLAEDNATETAYLIAVAAVWEQFTQLMTLRGKDSAAELEACIQTIRSTVTVEETPKIAVEVGTPS